MANTSTKLEPRGVNTLATFQFANLEVPGNSVQGNIEVSGVANLGDVSNVKIFGGSNNYVLKTDGSGNLSWTAQSGGGGGVGILGQGSNGAGGAAPTYTATTATVYGGSGGSGGGNGQSNYYGTVNYFNVNNYGGDYGGGGAQGAVGSYSGAGGKGAVRIIWPGNTRQFPSTSTADI